MLVDNQTFTLLATDRESDLWHRLSQHLSTRRHGLLVENVKDLDAVQTAKVRGRILELSYLLGLETDVE